jgi:hypothetical protein
LYKLFRQEFLQRYSRPLSPDAFSGFQTEGSEENNREVLDAFQFLMHTTIPDFAKSLDAQVLRRFMITLLSLDSSRQTTNRNYSVYISLLHTLSLRLCQVI